MEDYLVLQLKNRKFSELYMCYCGYAKCMPLHSFGPAVRPNYLIHIILNGKGRYRVGDTTYELGAGEGFVIEPEVQTFYQADKDDPWTYLWVGFSGSRAKEYLADVGLGNGRKTFRCTDTGEMKRMLIETLKRNTSTVTNDFLRESFLYSFFALLSENIGGGADSEEETENIYVRKALEFIQNNYHYGIRVSEIADYIGISRGYLHTLFTKHLHQPPREYLISYRLTRAEQLLCITDLTIEGVAQSCGYADPLIFSKLFKKKTGLTPSAYRRENWERNRETLRKERYSLDML